MGRPITLFTRQWEDLVLDDVASKAGSWGFDGLELACWGDHFEVDRALSESDYGGTPAWTASGAQRTRSRSSDERIRVQPGAAERAPGLDAAGKRTRGFKTVLVSEADMPFWQWWWPPGHIIGWEHTFIHEIHHLLAAIADDESVAPYGATFEDGYRAAEICDAILRSAEWKSKERVVYRA